MGTVRETQRIDWNLHNRVLEFVHRTVSLRRAFVLYGRGNVMLDENLRCWREAAGALVKGGDVIELTTAGNKLFFGNTLIGRDSPFVQELVENLRRLIVRRLSIQGGIQDEELLTLMEMLSHESRALLMKGGPLAFARERGMGHVSIIENVYLKRVGEEGEIPLDEVKLTLDDLQFIKGQLTNMISLAREGFELRSEERGLLAEAAEHPTFMGELLKEMTGGEPGVAADVRLQAAEISEVMDVIAAQIRKGLRHGDEFLGKSLTGTLMALEETLRLEILLHQFETAGQLPPLLADEVFSMPVERVRDLILDMYQRGRGELARARLLLERLVPDKKTYESLIPALEAGCRERGIASDGVREALRGILEKSVRGARGAPEQRPEEVEALRRQMEGLRSVSGDRSEIGAYLAGGDEARDETLILCELMGGEGATAPLAKKAGERIADLVKKGSGGLARRLFGELVTQARSGRKELAEAAGAEVAGLCRGGAARAIFAEPAPIEEKAALLAEIFGLMAAEDSATMWESLAGGGDEALQEMLAETARRDPRGLTEMLRAQAARGKPELLARTVEVLGVLPKETAVPLLTELCGHPEPVVRRKAVTLLGKAEGEEAVPLLRIMVGDPDAEVRRTVIPILGHLGGPEAASALLGIAAGGGAWELEERVLACRALGKCGGEGAVPALAAILAEIREQGRQEELGSLRGSALFALECIGSPEARKALDRDARRSGSLLRRIFGRR